MSFGPYPLEGGGSGSWRARKFVLHTPPAEKNFLLAVVPAQAGTQPRQYHFTVAAKATKDLAQAALLLAALKLNRA